ncbi:hypothetical protein LCGC14_1174840, partial [marine sediment metagenome]
MEVRMKVTTSISKPVNGTDDRIDGEVMATLPFLDEEGDFGVLTVEPTLTPEELKRKYEGRQIDKQWEQLQASLPDYSK